MQAAAPARFPLRLRIPAWTEKAEVLVNGKHVSCELRPGNWARIDRQWGPNDSVTLRLPMNVRVEFWNHQAITVKRGPLL